MLVVQHKEASGLWYFASNFGKGTKEEAAKKSVASDTVIPKCRVSILTTKFSEVVTMRLTKFYNINKTIPEKVVYPCLFLSIQTKTHGLWWNKDLFTRSVCANVNSNVSFNIVVMVTQTQRMGLKPFSVFAIASPLTQCKTWHKRWYWRHEQTIICYLNVEWLCRMSTIVVVEPWNAEIKRPEVSTALYTRTWI